MTLLGKKKILFANRCEFSNGGAIKMRDYFRHSLLASNFTSNIYIPPDNVILKDNPWYTEREYIVRRYIPGEADALVISGLGWDRFIPNEIKENSSVPIIYLVQGAFKTYTEPYKSQFAFKAIRISVSPYITDKIHSSGMSLNGPLFTIPNGIYLNDFPPLVTDQEKTINLLVLGLKNTVMAAHFSELLRASNIEFTLLNERVSQADFLGSISRARYVVCLPAVDEGFYLPALEAMHFGAMLICPDVGGNRHFCRHFDNCIVPNSYSVVDLITATKLALSLSETQRTKICEKARETCALNSIEREQNQFLAILENLPEIWASGKTPALPS